MELSESRALHVSQRRVVTVLALLISLVVGVLQFTGLSAMAGEVGHGIVPIGLTNEGGSGDSSSATGIVDITAGPCAGVVVSKKVFDAMPSRITLLHGSTVVARWEIYGNQRIAWVEPVGTYMVRSNQPPSVGRTVRITVSTSHVAAANLMPGCK